MNTYFCITKAVYDDGRRTVSISSVEAYKRPQNTRNYTNGAYFHAYYFDTIGEAIEFASKTTLIQ